MRQLCIERLGRLLGFLLPLAAQCLQEALALGEALELIDALVGLADAIFPGQIDLARVHRRHLEVDHALREVSEQVQRR